MAKAFHKGSSTTHSNGLILAMQCTMESYSSSKNQIYFLGVLLVAIGMLLGVVAGRFFVSNCYDFSRICATNVSCDTSKLPTVNASRISNGNRPDSSLSCSCYRHSKHRRLRKDCDWGTLQGWWQPSRPAGERWEVLDKTCGLQNLVTKHLANDTCQGALPAQQRRGILFLGDSVDNLIVEHLCSMSSGNYSGAHPDRNIFHMCQNTCSGLDMGMWYIPGVSITGPYLEFQQGNMIHRTILAYQAWQKHFGGKPDLVVLSANFWTPFPDRFTNEDDHQAEQQRQAEVAEWNDGGTNWHTTVPREFMDSWVTNFTVWLEHCKTLNPEGMHVYHTVGIPHWNYTDGRTANSLLRHIGRVHALNTVGRHASRMLHLHTIDFEAMTTGLQPSQYLADAHHTNAWFHIEAFNILLNYLDAHISRL